MDAGAPRRYTRCAVRGLYAIVDVAICAARGLDPIEVARAIAGAHPAALQLRAKDVAPREALAMLRAIGPACRTAGVALFANDRADLAALGGCDGVHVGQDDIAVSLVRRIAPGLRVGISTHTLDEVRRALVDRPDYIAFGPVFATTSKTDAQPVVGLDQLAAAVRLAEPTPVVAIGGIDAERAHAVGAVAPAAAMISALLPAEASAADLTAVTERARTLHLALSGRDAAGRAVLLA